MTEQIVSSQRAIPPPFELDLIDGDKRVGWLTRETVGFGGFANEAEAMHASWVAHRTLARRMAQREGRRPIPIDIEPLTLRTDDSIHASERKIATLVRPAAASMSGADSFGFELTFASPLDELGARAKAHLMYKTLRRSGLRWAMWLPEARPTQSTATVTRAATPAASVSTASPSRLALLTVVLSAAFLILALVVPEHVGGTLAAMGLAGLLAIRLSMMHVGRPSPVRAQRTAS